MISVVLPTKDEEEAIEEVVRKCRAVGVEEIVVVDDSRDKTPEIAEKLGCKVVRNVKGYGSAYLEGLKLVNGDVVVLMDADGSYDPLEIPRLVEPILRGEADVVLGSRFKGRIMPGAMPWHHRYLGNPLLTKFTNVLFGTKFSDIHTGFRAVRREVLQNLNLKCRGMEFATEFVLKTVNLSLRVVEVPITYHPRIGKSKLRSFRDGWRHLRLILATSPDQLFLIPSAMLVTVGVLLTMFVLLAEPIRTHTLVLGSLLILLGVQYFFFGISGKLYSKQIGFRRNDRLTSLFGRYSAIEVLMLLGIAILLIGLLSGYRIFSVWLSRGLGSLSEFNGAILSMTLIFVGFQVLLSSIFLSLFLLNEGDKEKM